MSGDLRAKCSCGAALELPRYSIATVNVRRTCRGCGRAWSITVKPIVPPPAGTEQAHIVNLTRVHPIGCRAVSEPVGKGTRRTLRPTLMDFLCDCGMRAERLA